MTGRFDPRELRDLAGKWTSGRPGHSRVTSAKGLLQQAITPAHRKELKDEAARVRKRLTPAQFKTVDQWTSGKGMVRRIQTGKVSAATADAFDEAMHEAPKVDGLVYRGVKPGSELSKLAERLRPGSTLRLDEPVSTSVDPGQASSFGTYLFEIDSPAASYISGISGKYTYEQEAVLAPGQFKVASVETVKMSFAPHGVHPVRVIRLQDVSDGPRSWRHVDRASLAAARRSGPEAEVDDEDRADRFVQGDGPGEFKLDAPASRAAGAVTNPEGTARLHEYWVHGEGAAKIRWGEPGDFDRCVLHLGKYIRDPKGYCAQAHHDALGIWPATHAAMEKHAGRAAMADNKPYGDVTYADPKNGKYPVDTAEHAKAAWSYINMPKNASQYPMNGVTLSEVKGRIKSACRKFGIEISDDSGSSSSRAESLAAYTRNAPLKDLTVRTTRDGKVVRAYMAVFNTPAEIHDADGDYNEELDPVVFNKAISDARPQGSRRAWRTGVFYNHGMTIWGTPSEQFSVPLGVPLDLQPDADGVVTETQYHRSEFADSIVEGLESGAIPGYSFSGRFLRSSPLIPRGGFRKDRYGNLPVVRRMESTLREYGPTPFPAYKEAAVVGMRAEHLLGAMASDPDFALRMLQMFRDSTPGEPLPPAGTPHDEEPPPRSRLVHSGRSVKEEMQAARAAFLLRQYRS